MTRPRHAFALFALAAALAAGSRAAAASEDDPDPRFGVTGDWGGLRRDLAAHGWSFDIRQKLEGAYAAAGAGRRSADGAGETRFGVIADLSKIAGVPGGAVHLMLTQRYGAGLASPSGLDPLMPFIEVHGRGNIARLTQLWYEQKLMGGRLDLKLGRVNPGSDFDAFACGFQNLTFCGSPPGNLVGDYWYNWPVSQWGGRAKWTVGPGYLQIGAYHVDKRNLERGFALDLAGGEGALMAVEGGVAPKLGPAGLPGSYLAGGWYATAKAPDLLEAVDGRPLPLTAAPAAQRTGLYGAYLSVRQQVSGAAGGRGLTLFANLTLADPRTARLDRQVAVGAEYHGLLPGRPDDVTGLAFGLTHLNDRLVRAERLARTSGGEPVQDEDEAAAELDYRVQAMPGVVLTPNLQYVIHAHGLPGRDGLVAGLKAVVKL